MGKTLARHSLPIEPPRRRDVQRKLPGHCRLRIADWGARPSRSPCRRPPGTAHDCELRIANCELRNCELRIANCGLRISWSLGMEWWSDGVMENPILQHSITPALHWRSRGKTVLSRNQSGQWRKRVQGEFFAWLVGQSCRSALNSLGGAAAPPYR